MTGKSRMLYDAILLQLRCIVPSFQPKLSVTDFEHALFSSIEFSFQCEIQGRYFHFRQSLWQKWQQLGLSTIKERKINVWLRHLMALPLLPFHKINPAFYELAPSTQDFHVSYNMKAFYQYIERQWIHAIASTMLSVYGRTRRTNSEVEGFHSNFGKRMAQKRPNFWYFLNKLKSVAKAYHLKIIQLGEGILTRRYRRQSSKRIDRFIGEAEQKLEEGRYTSMEYLKVVAHVTKQSIESVKNHTEEDENHDSENKETDGSPEECNFGLDCDKTDLTDFTFCSFCEN